MKLGQKVVCVKAHSQGAVELGQVYIVDDISFCPKCGMMLVDVGIRRERQHLCRCGMRRDTSSIRWIAASLFAPLEEKSETMIETVLESIREKV